MRGHTFNHSCAWSSNALRVGCCKNILGCSYIVAIGERPNGAESLTFGVGDDALMIGLDK